MVCNGICGELANVCPILAVILYIIQLKNIDKNFHHELVGRKNTEVEKFGYWSILVGRAGRSKNGSRHLILILCYFRAISNPFSKFHPNRMKNTEVENFHYWSVLVGQAGRSKNGCRHF